MKQLQRFSKLFFFFATRCLNGERIGVETLEEGKQSPPAQ